MAKKKKSKENPVAKHMETFNKPKTHEDKKKSLKRGKLKRKVSKNYWPSFVLELTHL